MFKEYWRIDERSGVKKGQYICTSLKLIHNFIDSATGRIQHDIEMEGGLKKFCKSEILMKIHLCST